MAGHVLVTESRPGHRARLAALDSAAWERSYLRWAAANDSICALLATTLAAALMHASDGYLPGTYLVLAAVLPALWLASVRLAGGYDSRFIGVGSDEFRRILNAAVSLTAGVAIVSYSLKLGVARSYVAVAMPCVTVSSLVMRYWLRKRLHRQRRLGGCMRRVVAAGHAGAVASLADFLRRENHHGMTVVGACLAGMATQSEIPGVPVYGGIEDLPSAVDEFGADSVAVLSCPEMSGHWLRSLAWQLEKTGTELCVAPTLLDVAGPRTTIRPVAGLPLLHLDHPELTGGRWVIKSVFDRLAAALALLVLAPVFVFIAVAIVADDRGSVFFRQTRVGKDGQPFKLCKFRSMVTDAEQRQAQLYALNEGAGVMFKLRADPRVTRVGSSLRRWSLDELPQLFNVLMGHMSLVGPRPALPREAAQ